MNSERNVRSAGVWGLSGTGEVENNVVCVSPEIEVTADKLVPPSDADGFWITDTPTNALKGTNNILPR